MPNQIVKGIIGNALTSAAPDHIIAVANDVFDEELQMYQSEINKSSGVYDISVAHASEGTPATYADLTAALGDGGENVPSNVRKPGMSIKFINSTSRQYEQYRLMSATWSTAVSDWQGVDKVPAIGSKNLAESGSVFDVQDMQSLDYRYINAIEQSLMTVATDRYVNYNTGIYTVSGAGLWKAYLYDLSSANLNVRKVRVYAAASGGVAASIAFYKSTTLNASNYIGTASVKANNGVLWYEAIIPDGAIMLLVSNYIPYLEAPVIQFLTSSKFVYHSDISKKVNQSNKLVESGAIYDLAAKNKEFVFYNNSQLITGKISTDGVVDSTATTYRINKPILLKAGHTVYLRNGEDVYCQAGMSVVFKSNANGDFVEDIISFSANTTKQISYTNDTETDIYIGVCGLRESVRNLLFVSLTEAGSASKVQENEENIDGLKQDTESISNLQSIDYHAVNAIEEGLVTVEADRYVNYETGAPSTSAANTRSFYKYDLSSSNINIRKVRVYIGSTDTVPAAIAFYKSTAIAASQYLKSVSIQCSAGVAWYEAEIPKDAVLMVVCNSTVILATPIIQFLTSSKFVFANDIEDIILSRNEEPTDEAIDFYDKTLSTYPLGTQFELNITSIAGNSPVRVGIKEASSGNVCRLVFIDKPGTYYFERTDKCFGIRLRKAAATGNVLNFSIKRTSNAIISPCFRCFEPNYRLVSSSVLGKTFDLGKLVNGYYINDHNISPSTYWCMSPIMWSNGYTIHIESDFTTYYVLIQYYWSPNFDVQSDYGVYQSQITANGDIHIDRGISGWQIRFRRLDSANINPDDVANAVSVSYVNGELWGKPVIANEVSEMMNSAGLGTALKLSQDGYNPNIFASHPNLYHFAANGFIIDGSNNNAIASQSLDDVELAARLGFKFIEANIQTTFDGNYVCIHGSSGAFGPECKSINPSVISTAELQETMINTKTVDWIKTNVRYDSYYEKYQTTIPTLEEFCIACRKHGIGIFCRIDKENVVNTCVKYLANNVIVYSTSPSVRNYFKGYVISWRNSIVSPESLLKEARNIGAPYLCSLGATTLANLIDNNLLEDFVAAMHAEGFFVGWTEVYDTESQGRIAIENGVDFNSTGHSVDPFEPNYEVFDTESDNLPTTTGTITNGIISLLGGDTITCGSSDKIVGKGWLSIRFNGTITINFGSYQRSLDRTITSDGSEDIVISDYFFKKATTLTITAGTATTVTKFLYKTSRC